ncbi:MAG: lysine--tRNA ligase [Kiritimatiellae bacterium]|nr:lysine--tRNA ligase [Kiritimatiellia bacterium]
MAQEKTPDQYRAQRIENRRKLAELGYAPYGKAFPRTGNLSEVRAGFEEGKAASVAGRIMTKRRMGKLMFIHLNDGTDAFQVLLKRDVLGEEAYNAAKLLDLGDFIGVHGTLFTTQAGEKTVEVKEWTLLSKAIRQPPEKWHGLQDTEERYRRRYLDLMSNPESRARFDKRHKILLGIRNYLSSKGFIEVETPIMQGQAGGAAAKPFVTHHNALDREMVLRIAPELYLKRLIVGGFDKVFELGKDFRNEGIDRTHNPEFTVLEVYEAYGDRTSMKNIIEGMLPYLCDTVLGTRQVPYGENGEIINFEPPYREVTQQELIKEKMGADWFELDYATARARAADAGLELVDEITDMVTLSHEVYDKMIESTLRQPTFVTRIPKQYVPLAKACPDDPSLVDVFEFVVAGKELCPGYTEQNDPEAQRAAFANQVEADAEPTDQDFVEALEYGMPPTGGLGLGIDRLVMFMTGTECIRDVILFPQMKSEN